MDIIVRDQNGNMLHMNGFTGPGWYLNDVESSRVEALDVKLSDDDETIILTVTIEES